MDARAAFAAAMRRPPEKVEDVIPGQVAYFRRLTSGERDRFLDGLWTGDKKTSIDADARLVTMLWVTEDGDPIGFSETDVIAMDGDLVAEFADRLLLMNGLKAKSVESAKKNS